MQIIKHGAEAILYKTEYEGNEVLVKERIQKKYRIEQIDKVLRKTRQRKEIKLLTEARKIGVNTPKIFHVDEKDFKIIMEYVDGIVIKDFLNSVKINEIKEICFEIGKIVGKLHSNGIVHGDLTTSNMILKDDKIYLIDFGLGEFTKKIEDFGVDINLLQEALKSTHFKIFKLCWDNIVKGYKEEYNKTEEVLKKVDEIEKRARYAQR